jgi:hypothetical protein
MAGYLAEKGLPVWQNGYNVIPIAPGDKRPSIDNWLEETTEAKIKNWKANGRADHGVGITTANNPLIDVDTLNEAMSLEMIDYVKTHIGYPLERIGKAPKIGLLFRTDKPFRKISSKVYTDPEGNRAQVEILCDGQQFVAFHVHPDTGEPYRWLHNEDPEKTPASELTPITEAQCRGAVAHFEETAETWGWQRRRSPGALALPSPAANDVPGFIDDDEIRGDSNEPCGLSESAIARTLMLIPNDEAFDAREDWIKIGFAVHHETEGSEFGRDLWENWSIQHPSHDEALFDKAWGSFGKRKEEFRGITFRYVIKVANQFKQAALGEQAAAFIQQLSVMDNINSTTDDIRPITAEIRKTEFDDLHQAGLIAALKTAFKRITGQNLGIKEAREMIKFKSDDRETPDWLNSWSYLTHIDRYFNVKTKQMLIKTAFDSAFGRYLPEDSLVSPSAHALNRVKIPVYHMAIYLPSLQEATFLDSQGLEWVNTYSTTSLDHSSGCG